MLFTTRQIRKHKEVARIQQYCEEIKNIDAVRNIKQLSKNTLQSLIQQAKQTSNQNTKSIEQNIINIYVNKEVGKITQQELMFLQQQNIKPSTLRAKITQYRKAIKNLLPSKYIALQRQYRIHRKKIIEKIYQQNLHILELNKALDNINLHPVLIKINKQTTDIYANNPIARNAQIALYKMTVGKNINRLINEQYKIKKTHRQQELQLIDHKEYFSIAIQLLEGTSDLYPKPNIHTYIHNTLMGICALTGRRPVEVIKTGKFQYNETYSLIFTGQAKTREEHRAAFEIDTLCLARKILDAHRQLKTVLTKHSLGDTSLTNRQVNNRLFTSKATKQLQIQTFASIYPKERIPETINLRSTYGDIAYEIFDPPMSKIQYLKKIMGHKDANSADAYVQNKITREDKIYLLEEDGEEDGNETNAE